MIDTSLFTKLNENESAKEEARVIEVAKENVLRQQQMEQAGELQRVYYVGPGGYIPGFYSPIERAFLPEFTVEK
jgi:hypothetical protein